VTGAKVKESDFDDPFAQWLRNDLDEVTEVASLGGADLKSEWARRTSWVYTSLTPVALSPGRRPAPFP